MRRGAGPRRHPRQRARTTGAPVRQPRPGPHSRGPEAREDPTGSRAESPPASCVPTSARAGCTRPPARCSSAPGRRWSRSTSSWRRRRRWTTPARSRGDPRRRLGGAPVGPRDRAVARTSRLRAGLDEHRGPPCDATRACNRSDRASRHARARPSSSVSPRKRAFDGVPGRARRAQPRHDRRRARLQPLSSQVTDGTDQSANAAASTAGHPPARSRRAGARAGRRLPRSARRRTACRPARPG